MKRTNQIAFFLISILSVFMLGTGALVTTQPHHLDLVLEEHLIEEEREVCSVSFNIQEVDVEISGGNPDNQSITQTKSTTQDLAILIASKRPNLNSPQRYVYTGKVPLYLRYHSLKLHC